MLIKRTNKVPCLSCWSILCGVRGESGSCSGKWSAGSISAISKFHAADRCRRCQIGVILSWWWIRKELQRSVLQWTLKSLMIKLGDRLTRRIHQEMLCQRSATRSFSQRWMHDMDIDKYHYRRVPSRLQHLWRHGEDFDFLETLKPEPEMNLTAGLAFERINNMAKIVDDCLAYDADFDTHVHHVREILTRARACGITISTKKFEFGMFKVDFCSFTVCEEGWKFLIAAMTTRLLQSKTSPCQHLERIYDPLWVWWISFPILRSVWPTWLNQ